MGNIEFRMAALTNVGRVRTNNEDNFLVDSDLSDDKWFFTQNEQKYLYVYKRQAYILAYYSFPLKVTLS